MLELHEVHKRFGKPGRERIALDGVTLSLGRGQIMGVFGPSGSGKTTLLRVAAGLTQPDNGTVAYAGERLDRMSSTERTRIRRREVASVWATEPGQEHLGVLDHVALPLLVDGCGHRRAARRAREALLACEAESCAEMELHELSDGERQRVGIARALVAEPRLLLADGPASSLSTVEQEQVMVLLSDLAREARVAVLLTASDARTLIRADPVLYLRDGRLLEPELERDASATVYRFPPARERRAATDA